MDRTALPGMTERFWEAALTVEGDLETFCGEETQRRLVPLWSGPGQRLTGPVHPLPHSAMRARMRGSLQNWAKRTFRRTGAAVSAGIR